MRPRVLQICNTKNFLINWNNNFDSNGNLIEFEILVAMGRLELPTSAL